MDLEKFSELIAEAAKESFKIHREKYGGSKIIGYSILSHDTADSCGPVMATKKAYDTYSEKYKDHIDDFRYSPVEWDLFDSSSVFDQVNKVLAELYNQGDDEVDPNWHDKFREFVFEANVRALEKLLNEGFFGDEESRNQLFIIFCLSDSYTAETHEPQWVKRLNTQTVSNSYMKWHSSNG